MHLFPHLLKESQCPERRYAEVLGAAEKQSLHNYLPGAAPGTAGRRESGAYLAN